MNLIFHLFLAFKAVTFLKSSIELVTHREHNVLWGLNWETRVVEGTDGMDHSYSGNIISKSHDVPPLVMAFKAFRELIFALLEVAALAGKGGIAKNLTLQAHFHTEGLFFERFIETSAFPMNHHLTILTEDDLMRVRLWLVPKVFIKCLKAPQIHLLFL